MLILFLVLCAYIIYPKERLCGKIYNDCEYGFAPLWICPINRKLSDTEINGRIDETVS